jgi:2-keto-3-deoxy-L-rhamnonate aldolase RhmA
VVINAIETVVTRAHARNIPVCLGVIFPDAETRHWLAKGANFILTGEDTAVFANGLSRALAHVRGLAGAG